MAALPHPALPADSLPVEKPKTHYRRARALWIALEILDPPPGPAVLEAVARFSQSLTPIVVLRPDEGLLLEIQGSLKIFSGLSGIKQRLTAELARRGMTFRAATAPTPLAASWLVRYESVDVADEGALAGAIGRLPIAATAWPDQVQLMLRQMGLASIADCLRLPRSGFARRIGREQLDDLDRALGKKPDFPEAYQAPQTFCRVVEFTTETADQAAFASALSDIVLALEQALRQQQMQVREVTLAFRHLRAEATRTRIRFVDPVHTRERILDPLLARIERLGLSEPAVALSLTTSSLLPLKVEAPGLLPLSSAQTARAVPEYALVECLRGRFGMQSVHGIDWVAEHRPERAWRHWIDRPAVGVPSGPARPPHDRPLWLLSEPQRRKMGSDPIQVSAKPEWGLTPFSAPFSAEPERIESGWWDGFDVRRDYHVVVGPAGQKLWFYRDCRTQEWYLHGLFG